MTVLKQVRRKLGAMRLGWKVLLALSVTAGVFVASALAMPRWWEWSLMPSPEQWSAFFGASALVALAFAWYQIRQVDQSNRALIASNELQRQSNLELSRPRVVVTAEVDRFVTKGRGDPLKGTVWVAVRNIGRSAALNVRLTSDTAFTSLPAFFKPGKMPVYYAKMNGVFDGSDDISLIQPDDKYIWFLGRYPEVIEATGIPRRYAVAIEYSSPLGQTYSEHAVIDFDLIERMEIPVPPLERIGKDIEVLGRHVKRIADRS